MLDPFAQPVSNIVVAPHAHYARFTKTYGLYPSHDPLQVQTQLGVVASVCTPLLTRTQQLPTLLAQQCWELLRPFARSLRHQALCIIIVKGPYTTDNKNDITHSKTEKRRPRV